MRGMATMRLLQLRVTQDGRVSSAAPNLMNQAGGVLGGEPSRLTHNHNGGQSMATREELLAHLWSHIINLELREMSLDTIIAECRRHPGRPFSDTGPAIERILAAGVSRSDLTLALRFTAYEAVFGTLYALSDPGA